LIFLDVPAVTAACDGVDGCLTVTGGSDESEIAVTLKE
jgi:hypothetical protein